MQRNNFVLQSIRKVLILPQERKCQSIKVLQGRRRIIMWEKIPKSSSSSTTDNTNVVAVVLCGEKKIESENF